MGLYAFGPLAAHTFAVASDGTLGLSDIASTATTVMNSMVATAGSVISFITSNWLCLLGIAFGLVSAGIGLVYRFVAKAK